MDPLACFKTCDANHFVAVWYETMIAVWWGPASADGVADMSSIARGLLRNATGPVNFLLIIEPSSPTPKGAVLDAFSSFTRDVVSRMGNAIAVTEGGSFRAASIRSVAAALALAMPKRLPYKFMETVEQGVSALAPSLGEASGGYRGLLGAVQTMRSSPQGHAPR